VGYDDNVHNTNSDCSFDRLLERKIMIKFTCIKPDKAETARRKLSKLGLDVRVIDRTILALGDYTNPRN